VRTGSPAARVNIDPLDAVIPELNVILAG